MKKFDYKKKPSLIRTLKEPPKKKKKINWDRVLFLGTIGVGLFFLANKVYRSMALIQADGQVILESVKVNFINDIRLKRLHVSEGDTVFAKDTLFSYWNELHNYDGSKSVQINNSRDWITREILTVRSKISKKRIELSETIILIDEYVRRNDAHVQMVMLDATDHSSLQSSSNQLLSLRSKEKMIRGEIRILHSHLSGLLSEKTQFLGGSGGYSSSLTERIYRSHMYGIIGEVQIQPKEVCYEGDYIFSIHSPDDISIHAYFSQEDISRIFVKAIVNVSFPDGSSGRGFIKKYNISTKELPPEFQKKYEPTERIILAEIAPIDDFSSELWKKFYKMDVKISLPKYNPKVYFPESTLVTECQEGQ